MPIYRQSQKKDGKNKYIVKVNYTDSLGNHRQLTRHAYGSQEAKELERMLERQLRENSGTRSMTLEELYSEYCNNICYDLKESTMKKKKTIYNTHIGPHIGGLYLKKFSSASVFSEWKRTINEKNLRVRTKQNAYKELNAVLNYAIQMDYLGSHALHKVGNFKSPNEPKKEMSFYTAEEFKQYIAAALVNAEQSGIYDYYVFFNIAYFTGCRKGEIHALRWSDIDRDYLKITKSINQKLIGDDVETTPKTESSIRTIQLPAPLIAILEEHKERQKKLLKAISQRWEDSGFICGYFKPLRDSSIENYNTKFAAAANLHHIRIHDFRHSHASVLINSNINAMEVARRLGHSTVEQTLKTYAHLFPKETEKAMSVLNNL